MLRTALLVCAFTLPTGIGAAEPTFSDLLATPSATDIAARWKSVCYDHAGDRKAQQAAAKAQNITWPYQAMFLADKGEPSCVIASTTEASTTPDALFDAAALSAAPLAPFLRAKKDDQVFGTVTIADKSYRIEAGLHKSPGTLIAVVALTEVKKDQK